MIASCSSDFGRVRFSDPENQEKFKFKLEEKNITYESNPDHRGKELITWRANSQKENRELINSTMGPYFGIEFDQDEKLNEFASSEMIKALLDGLYFIIPQTAELMGLTLIDLALGKGIVNFQPIITSFLFLILFLVFSLLLFRRKDY